MLHPAPPQVTAAIPDVPGFTGLVTVGYDRVFGDSSIGKAEVAPALRRLGTGTVELQVEPAAGGE